MTSTRELALTFRTQILVRDQDRRNQWQVALTPVRLLAEETALLLCDVWDKHRSRGATERLDAMSARMGEVVEAARTFGIQIIHSPSDTMARYVGMPARERMLSAPRIEPPKEIEHADPPLPVDASDRGSDTDEKRRHRAHTRQHPAIRIDQERDGISEDGREIYSFLRGRGIENLLIMGVHTNMCVLDRSFGIKQMVRWGMTVALIRDLTDSLYNPAMPPYVSHDEGTRLVVEYIEKFWCPTITSQELLEACGR